MKLSEVATSDYVKLLVFGDSGVGKTCLLETFPKDVYIFDFDKKVSSLVNYLKAQKKSSEGFEVMQYDPSAQADSIKKFQTELASLQAMFKNKASNAPKTVAVDSFTLFAKYLLYAYPKLQPNIKRGAVAELPVIQDYQLLAMHLADTVKSLLSLPCNVVFTAHLGIDKDETSGAIIREPLIPGKFASDLPIYFEEVYLMKIRSSDGKRVLQTQSDAQYKLRCQRNLDKEIQPSYDAIINNLKA